MKKFGKIFACCISAVAVIVCVSLLWPSISNLIGGVMNGQKVSVATIQELAALPSLDELRGKLVGLLVAPAGAIARVCKAYSEKEEQAA